MRERIRWRGQRNRLDASGGRASAMEKYFPTKYAQARGRAAGLWPAGCDNGNKEHKHERNRKADMGRRQVCTTSRVNNDTCGCVQADAPLRGQSSAPHPRAMTITFLKSPQARARWGGLCLGREKRLERLELVIQLSSSIRQLAIGGIYRLRGLRRDTMVIHVHATWQLQG